MDSNKLIPISLAVLAIVLITVPSNAAEFHEDDILPKMSSFVFSHEAIAITLQTATYLGKETKHFVAKRNNYEFHEVSGQVLSELLKTNYYHRQFRGNVHLTGSTLRYDLGQRDIQVERQSNECVRDSRVPLHISHEKFQFSIKLQCASRIYDAVQINDELWIATFADPYDYYGISQEGLIVASLEGNVDARIDTGDYPIHGLALDPWTQDVWVVSQERLMQISEEHDVKRRYWPILDFDETQGRPGLFITEAPERLLSNPFALIALGLGEAHYQKFYNAIEGLPDLRGKGIMYAYSMNGPSWSHKPMLPQQLNVLIEDAEPTGSWRRFLCMLDDQSAKELCELELDAWPR